HRLAERLLAGQPVDERPRRAGEGDDGRIDLRQAAGRVRHLVAVGDTADEREVQPAVVEPRAGDVDRHLAWHELPVLAVERQVTWDDQADPRPHVGDPTI